MKSENILRGVLMNEYVILTDSACDIKPETLKEWGVESLEMCFRFENEDRDYRNNEMDISKFYGRMKDGEIAKTAAINPDEFYNAFEAVLKQGKDVLYLGFSSGLSTTYNSSRIAAEELLEKYPDRKIINVDTLAASAGQGLLVYLAVKKKAQGATMEEIASYIDDIKLNTCLWFTVDDLVYLKRGGRVSPAVAFVGTVLGIKPVLHVDNEGKLVSVAKARGRKAALNSLVEKYGELANTSEEGIIFISHANCIEEANVVKEQFETKYNAKVEIITDIGPVIGAHAGPGTMAVFFMGKER